MNARQRDLFLWVWSRRRGPGQAAIALRGALIGALGGVVFAFLLSPGYAPDIPAYRAWERMFSEIFNHLLAMGLAAPAFGFIGWLLAGRVYAANERMYQAMLAAGASVPAEKPAMQLADRGPALAVAIAAAVIIGFVVTLFVMAATGAL